MNNDFTKIDDIVKLGKGMTNEDIFMAFNLEQIFNQDRNENWYKFQTCTSLVNR